MRAFDIHAPLPAAGVVLLADERRDDLPVLARQRRSRPGRDRVGARRLRRARTASGVAYGFGLQAIEASVGIGVGLLFLAREGLSFAMLRVMPTADQAEVPAEEAAEEPERPAERAAAS